MSNDVLGVKSMVMTGDREGERYAISTETTMQGGTTAMKASSKIQRQTKEDEDHGRQHDNESANKPMQTKQIETDSETNKNTDYFYTQNLSPIPHQAFDILYP